MSLAENAAAATDKIEAEMKRIGLWQVAPPKPEQMHFTKAFAMDTMSYAQWLQLVFLPQVREAIASKQFPSSSNVGAQAIREFDGVENATGLVTLLSEFDALFE